MALNTKYTRGIEIEISGNATKLASALKDADSAVKKTQSELKTLKNSLKLEWDASNFKRAQELAQRAVQQTADKADILKKALAELDKQGAEKDTEKYEAIRRELSYVQVAAQKAKGELEELNKTQVEKLNQSLANTVKKLDNVEKSISNAGNKLTMGVTLPLVAAGTAAFHFAKNTEESFNKVNEVFQQSAGLVISWSENTLKSYGLAQGTALDMAALYGDMATSMGYSRSEAAELSMELVGLAADMASFKNMSVDQTNTALKSIFTGETESLKNLGVVMTQTNLKAFAMAQGFETAYEKMDQAQQVAVRMQYVLDATKNSQGDFARTSDGAANQVRIFQESLKEAAATAGKELLPIITPIITNLSKLIQSFEDLDDGTRKNLVTAGLVLATLGPMLKLTGGGVKIIEGAASAMLALKTATAAKQVVDVSATASQAALNTTMAANPAGAMATAISAVVAVLSSLILVNALTAESTDEVTDSIKACIKEVQTSREEYEKLISGLEEEEQNTLSMVSALEKAVAAEEKTAAQKAAILSLVDQLNEAIPNLSLAYNEESDSLNLTAEAVKRLALEEAKRKEQEAMGERLGTAAIEEVELAEKLIVAKQALAEAENDLAEKRQNLYGTGRRVETETFNEMSAISTLKGQIAELTQEQHTNQEELVTLTAEYDAFSVSVQEGAESTEKSGAAAEVTAQQLAAMSEATEQQREATSSLLSETNTLNAAFAEQEKNGSLSAGTILKMVDAGYAAALSIDRETGAVRINSEAYMTLAKAKIEEQIATVEAGIRGNYALEMEQEAEAANLAAQGFLNLAATRLTAASAARGEIDAARANIAALMELKNNLGKVVTGSWSSSSVSSGKSSASGKTAQKTEAEKKEEEFKKELSTLKYYQDMDLISENEYYIRLAALRDKYLKEDSDTWRSVTVELHHYLEKQRDDALKEEEEALKEWETHLNEMADRRIETIKRQQAAEESRLQSMIDGINGEIAARRKLREEEEADEKIARAKKTLDAAQAQLTFARDDYEAAELKKEVERVREAYDAVLLEKSDAQWYDQKEKEIAALERERAQAAAWAEEQEQEAQRLAQRELERQNQALAYQQRLAEATGGTNALEAAVSGAVAAAMKTVNNVSTTTSQSTVNNLSITNNASALTSGQVVRAVEKVLDKLV